MMPGPLPILERDEESVIRAIFSTTHKAGTLLCHKLKLLQLSCKTIPASTKCSSTKNIEPKAEVVNLYKVIS